jgi:hypothetical protein
MHAKFTPISNANCQSITVNEYIALNKRLIYYSNIYQDMTFHLDQEWILLYIHSGNFLVNLCRIHADKDCLYIHLYLEDKLKMYI